MRTESLTEDGKGEPFELIAMVGRGGFAETYKARVIDEDLLEEFGTEIVAIKIPYKDKQRVFKRELETNILLYKRLKGLNALNIVRYLGFDLFDGKMIMVMEYVGGGSLRGRLGGVGNQKRQPIEESVRIAEGILKGLAVIHQEHFFHRDIKPENILMDGNTPKIADLGISRMLQAQELATTKTGTLYYMSPEILGPEGASFNSDIWSVGVTLYEMVSGKLPFGHPVGSRETPFKTMIDKICSEPHVPACDVCGEVPQALSDILDRALKKDPRDRFGSAEEMYQALKRFRKTPEDSLEAEIAAIRAESPNISDISAREGKLRALLAKYPREPRVYQSYGEFLNGLARHAEALEAFQKGIALDDENALLHWDLALAFQCVGQRAAAVKSLQKALALGLDASLQRYATNLLKVLQGGGG